MAQDPPNDLRSIEDQLAARRGSEAGQSLWNQPVSYGPRRTAEQVRDGLEIHGLAEDLVLASLATPGHCYGQLYPRVTAGFVNAGGPFHIGSKSDLMPFPLVPLRHRHP